MFMAKGRSGKSRMFRFKVSGSRFQGSQVLAAKGPRFKVRPFRKKIIGSRFKVRTSRKNLIGWRFKV
jgi:hypothetical protein